MIRMSRLSAMALFLVCVSAHAQTCRDDIPATAPDSRYRNNGDGTVTDLATNLIWKQCTEGLGGAGCAAGSPSTFTWQRALQHAEAHVFAGSSLWRLPNKKELASLVEQRCYNPAINSQLFPDTPYTAPYAFWSSSPYAGSSYGAWFVLFYGGYVDDGDKGAQFYIRLVRGGQ